MLYRRHHSIEFHNDNMGIERNMLFGCSECIYLDYFSRIYLGLIVQRFVLTIFSADNAHILKLCGRRIFSWGETLFAFAWPTNSHNVSIDSHIFLVFPNPVLSSSCPILCCLSVPNVCYRIYLDFFPCIYLGLSVHYYYFFRWQYVSIINLQFTGLCWVETSFAFALPSYNDVDRRQHQDAMMEPP